MNSSEAQGDAENTHASLDGGGGTNGIVHISQRKTIIRSEIRRRRKWSWQLCSHCAASKQNYSQIFSVIGVSPSSIIVAPPDWSSPSFSQSLSSPFHCLSCFISFFVSTSLFLSGSFSRLMNLKLGGILRPRRDLQSPDFLLHHVFTPWSAGEIQLSITPRSVSANTFTAFKLATVTAERASVSRVSRCCRLLFSEDAAVNLPLAEWEGRREWPGGRPRLTSSHLLAQAAERCVPHVVDLCVSGARQLHKSCRNMSLNAAYVSLSLTLWIIVWHPLIFLDFSALKPVNSHYLPHFLSSRRSLINSLWEEEASSHELRGWLWILTWVLSGQKSTYLCSWLEASSEVILRLSTARRAAALRRAALGGFWQWTQCTSTMDSCKGQNTTTCSSHAAGALNLADQLGIAHMLLFLGNEAIKATFPEHLLQQNHFLCSF